MDTFFLIKKLISVIIMPVSLCLLMIVIALLYYRAKPRFSFKLILVACLTLALFSTPFVANQLIHSLEDKYESFSRFAGKVDYIVVLGCGHESNEALPDTSQLRPCSLQRIVEGIRILRLHPEATLIVSGYGGNDPMPNAERVKRAAISLGVKEHKILTESYPKDTQEEAQLISPRVKGTNVVLVTDASHLPRAMNYFQMQGVSAIPAPAGFYVKNINAEKYWYVQFLPSASALQTSSIAWYEYMGRVLQWFQQLTL